MRLTHAVRVRVFFAGAAPLLFIFAMLAPVKAAALVGALGSYYVVFVGFLFLMVFAAVLLIMWYPSQSPVFWMISLLVGLWVVPKIALWALPIIPHEIRCVAPCQPIAGFPFTVDEAIDRWNRQASPSRTMVVVAIAGGGARAAYWSASVLGAIQDSNASFARRLFAISAVSGGALGGAAFAALGSAPPDCRVHGRQSRSFRECLATFLSYDFLNPIMASALTGDLVETLTGIPIVDRAAALERAWETAWDQVFVGKNWMEAPFDERWRTDPLFHANMLLNGTIADPGNPSPPAEFSYLRPGERVVTSNLRLAHHTDLTDTPIANPADRRRISLSTAIDNSTRFPFVEPVGAVPAPIGPGSSRNPPTYYVADGGYYDNYGAATLLDLLHMLTKHAGRLSIDQLAVIQISSDREVSSELDLNPWARPELRPPASSEPTDRCKPTNEAAGSSSEAMTAYQTAMAAREWSGLSYAMQLRALEQGGANADKLKASLNNLQIKYFHFGIHDIDPPLGWSLSEPSRRCIDGLLTKGSYVDREILKLNAFLEARE